VGLAIAIQKLWVCKNVANCQNTSWSKIYSAAGWMFGFHNSDVSQNPHNPLAPQHTVSKKTGTGTVLVTTFDEPTKNKTNDQ
jgi:hypothetical protein